MALSRQRWIAPVFPMPTVTNIVSFEWYERAELLAPGVNPLVTLTTGTQTVTLNVTDDTGDFRTDTVVITVNAGGALPQGAVSIRGPSSINRGDKTSFTVILTNIGNSMEPERDSPFT